MKDIPLNVDLPFKVPAGWQASLLTNVSNDQRPIYEQAIRTFDWEQFYQSKVHLEICDIAVSMDGQELESAFSLWVVFDPSIISDADLAFQQELFEKIKILHAQMKEQLKEAGEDQSKLIPFARTRGRRGGAP